MTQLFRFLILGPLVLLFGLVGLPCVWVAVALLEWSEEPKEEFGRRRCAAGPLRGSVLRTGSAALHVPDARNKPPFKEDV